VIDFVSLAVFITVAFGILAGALLFKVFIYVVAIALMVLGALVLMTYGLGMLLSRKDKK